MKKGGMNNNSNSNNINVVERGNSNSSSSSMCTSHGGDSGLVLTTDPKPRLRWTVELHERFVDAVTQLGGPDSTFNSFLPSLDDLPHTRAHIYIYIYLIQFNLQ